MTTTTVKERPILFSGPMVRATLEDRSQTRQMVKETLVDQDEVYKQSGTRYGWMNCADIGMPQDFRVIGPVGVVASLGGPTVIRCPYGKPGDRLWVKEALIRHNNCVCYAAEYPDEAVPVPDPDDPDRPARWQWKRATLPSMFMPRWASRILLELTDVRVERLQEISEADIQAEGVPAHVAEITFRKCYRDSDERAAQRRKCFRELWDSINVPGSWNANPWVWALTFKRIAT